uniref:Putative photosynthetic reaction centre, L/M n=1 Tax=Helianthus annuus TaxID=4232 RepID=A0A1Y3BX87_HELAN
MKSANEGYRIRSRGKKLSYRSRSWLFCRLIFNMLVSTTLVLYFLPSCLAVVGIWFTALGISTMASTLNGFNFNQSVVDSQGLLLTLGLISLTVLTWYGSYA